MNNKDDLISLIYFLKRYASSLEIGPVPFVKKEDVDKWIKVLESFLLDTKVIINMDSLLNDFARSRKVSVSKDNALMEYSYLFDLRDIKYVDKRFYNSAIENNRLDELNLSVDENVKADLKKYLIQRYTD